MLCSSLFSCAHPAGISSICRAAFPSPENVNRPRFRIPEYCRTTRRRGVSVVTRAGPSTASYVFAFVLPLSLLAVTIFTSFKIADKLDQKYFEELAVNMAIMEAEEGDEDDEEEPAPDTLESAQQTELESP